MGLFKTEYMVESYGKLPFYQDYINILATPEAKDFQDWLLTIFGQEKMRIPQGFWHFVFKSRKDSDLITGIIAQSSDGIREFPYSLFINLETATIKRDFRWGELFLIRDALIDVYGQLDGVSDINGCYGLISGMTIISRRKDVKSKYLRSVSRPGLDFLSGGNNDYPAFALVSENNAICLGQGGDSGNDIILRWNQAAYGPPVQAENENGQSDS